VRGVAVLAGAQVRVPPFDVSNVICRAAHRRNNRGRPRRRGEQQLDLICGLQKNRQLMHCKQPIYHADRPMHCIAVRTWIRSRRLSHSTDVGVNSANGVSRVEVRGDSLIASAGSPVDGRSAIPAATPIVLRHPAIRDVPMPAYPGIPDVRFAPLGMLGDVG